MKQIWCDLFGCHSDIIELASLLLAAWLNFVGGWSKLVVHDIIVSAWLLFTAASLIGCVAWKWGCRKHRGSTRLRVIHRKIQSVKSAQEGSRFARVMSNKGGRPRGAEWRHFQEVVLPSLQDRDGPAESSDPYSSRALSRSVTVCIHCGTTVSRKAARLRLHLKHCKLYLEKQSSEDLWQPGLQPVSVTSTEVDILVLESISFKSLLEMNVLSCSIYPADKWSEPSASEQLQLSRWLHRSQL